MHPQQSSVEYQTAAMQAAQVPIFHQLDYSNGMDMMMGTVTQPGMAQLHNAQMNHQSYLATGAQYPNVTMGAMPVYATSTSQYIQATPNTHYVTSNHPHQAGGSQVPPPPPGVPHQYAAAPQPYQSAGQQGQPTGQAPSQAYVPVSSNYGPESIVMQMQAAQQPLQLAMTQPYIPDQSHQPQTPSGTPRPTGGAGSGSESGGATPTSAGGSANPMNLPIDELKSRLLRQLEYYFSRENLAHDTYLMSQMDADQFVDIATIASFNQIKKLTNDLNLVTQVLRESTNVQVDLVGKKVRPNHTRCTVILREIADDTQKEEVEALFSNEKCPKTVHVEFAHNNTWYVTFETDKDALDAYQYLREDVKVFKGKQIMARIKPKPMNRLPSGPGGASSQAPPTPTGLVTPIATTPVGVVPTGVPTDFISGIPLATSQPVVHTIVDTGGAVANSASKNGYPGQGQQQPPPQPPQPQQAPQQPSSLPYPMMTIQGQPLQQQQQTTMVQPAGPAQTMQPGNGQQGGLVTMATTTLPQPPYHYVASNNTQQNVQGTVPNFPGGPTIIYAAMPNNPGAYFNPAGILAAPWGYHQQFTTFSQNVIPQDSQAMFQQAQYKPTGGRGGGGPHNNYGKPRRGRGGGSLSGDRMQNDQRYQNQSTFQPYVSGGGVNNGSQQQSSQQHQPYYNSYRGNSRASWDGNASKKGPSQGANGSDHSAQQYPTNTAGPIPASSPGQVQPLVQPVMAPTPLPPTTLSSQQSHFHIAQQNELSSNQNQPEPTPQLTTTPPIPTPSLANQVEIPPSDPSPPEPATTPVSTTPSAPVLTSSVPVLSASFSSGGNSGMKPAPRSHEEPMSGSYHNSGNSGSYSGYHHANKSSMESLHRGDQSRRGSSKPRGGSRGGRSEDGSMGSRDLSSGRGGGYSGGRGNYHTGGGYRGGHNSGSTGSISGGPVEQGGHHHSHLHHAQTGGPGVPPVANIPAKTPPAPEFEMKGNDFPALPGVTVPNSEPRKTSDSGEGGTTPWGETNRFLDVVKGTAKVKLTSSNSSSTSSRKDPAEDQETEQDCGLTEKTSSNSPSQIVGNETKSSDPGVSSSSTKTVVNQSPAATATKSDEGISSGPPPPPLVNGELKGAPVTINTAVANESTSGLTSPGSGQKSSDGNKQFTYAQMAQKKKEEREAAEKAALAQQANANQDQPENAKKFVKDSAVNKKLHGVNQKDVDHQKSSNVISSAAGATNVQQGSNPDRSSSSIEPSKSTQNTFHRSKTSGSSSNADNRKSGGQQRHSGGNIVKRSLSGIKPSTPTSSGAVLGTSSHENVVSSSK